MAEGLKGAVLATIATREWTVEGKSLTGAQVVAMYYALESVDPHAPHRAIGSNGLNSDRRFDRAIQILRRKGLARFDGKKWVRILEPDE